MCQSLRMGEGDEIGIVDGGGNKYLAEIVLAHPKRCGIRILKNRKFPIRGGHKCM